MPKYTHSVDSLTLQVLTWMSQQGMRERLKRQMETQGWITTAYRHMHQVVRDCLEEALVSLMQDRVYGPALMALARRRLTHTDVENAVAGGIEIDELVEAHGLFYAEKEGRSPSYAVPPPALEDTHILLGCLNEYELFAERLSQFSQHWRGDVCCGAASLRLFFVGYLDILAFSLPVPSFVIAVLRSSLTELYWHEVAAQIMQRTPSPCRCASLSTEDLAPARADLLRARFVAVGEAMQQASLGAPEPQRDLALFLADFCAQAGNVAVSSYEPTKEENA